MNTFDKIEQCNTLATKLNISVAVRKAFDLPMEGAVKTQKVKPSGVLMNETHKHIVEVFLDNELQHTVSVPEFDTRMEKAINEVRGLSDKELANEINKGC